MIQFDQATKWYDDQCALNQVTFTVDPGEMVFLTGHSGAGKSTLLKLILGLEALSDGAISIGGESVKELSARQIRLLRRQVGLVGQDPLLLKRHTVYDNVVLPLLIDNVPRKELLRKVLGALEWVDLSHKMKSIVDTLSCGEQQRVRIAQAIVKQPKILLADEPTGNLDPELAAEIVQIFGQLNQAGTTVMIASHHSSLLNRLNYRRLLLKKGALVEEESPGC